MSAFIYFPRNRPLTPPEQKCLDEYSRQMAKIMIRKQDEYRFYERLAKKQKSCDSGYGSCTPTTSQSSSNSTSPTPTGLVPNPFYDPSFVVASSKSTSSVSSIAPSPSSVKLVPNPFYDPSLASSTTSSTTSSLVANPFYDPEYVREKQYST